MQKLNLTESERVLLRSLINGLYAEPGFSDVDAIDLSHWTGIPTKSIRGSLSSLIKKGIVSVESTDTFGAEKQYQIVYLNQEYWYLHPRWKEVSNG
jgi:hypothetical protein